ncbi:MAG: hypothetical protein OMM_00016 [Candidatus Magnetoglobus multicellularis str. Araruama]|uniref:Uncharacterized protein n=1 Tax=Candidatus Magnetoglobus multicellularis str. Araruama TaxID=890399 RepID=A0A1V1PIW4_9BACT|nr:MAG: hypothetical protein OMM_00016 [Candidatus Magnetoglobus multicellularis str. Araruama]
MGHPDHDTKTTNISLELWYDQLSMRLGNHISALDGSHHVFCIVTDAPQVSPVHVKDYFDPGTSELHSQFKWDIHSFLTRMIRKKPALNDLSRSFLVACQGNQNNVLFQDTIMEIQAEFPHAKCYPVTAMTALSNMRIRWTNELTETGKQVKSMPGLETKYKTIQFLLDCLPCNDCPHESTCQHRGSKRSRELVQTFHKFQSDERNRYLFLEITASYFHSLLISLDWINASDEILPKGQMASQLGPIATPLLVECLFNQIIPLKNQHLEKTILAGFLPNELSMPGHIDLRFPAISACYQECWPHLKQAAYQMLRLGLQPQMPDYLLSCLYYSLTSDKDQRVSDQTHLTQTNVDYFIAMVDDLYSKAIS